MKIGDRVIGIKELWPGFDIREKKGTITNISDYGHKLIRVEFDEKITLNLEQSYIVIEEQIIEQYIKLINDILDDDSEFEYGFEE